MLKYYSKITIRFIDRPRVHFLRNGALAALEPVFYGANREIYTPRISARRRK